MAQQQSVLRSRIVALVLRTIRDVTGIRDLRERTRFADLGLTVAVRRGLQAPLRQAAAARGWPQASLTAALCGAAETPRDMVNAILRDLATQEPKARKKTARARSRGKKIARKTKRVFVFRRTHEAGGARRNGGGRSFTIRRTLVRPRRKPTKKAAERAAPSPRKPPRAVSKSAAKSTRPRSAARKAPRRMSWSYLVMPSLPPFSGGFRAGGGSGVGRRKAVKSASKAAKKRPLSGRKRKKKGGGDMLGSIGGIASYENVEITRHVDPADLAKSTNGKPRGGDFPPREDEAPTAAAEAAVPDSERRISIWVGKGDAALKRALKIGATYLLNFKVGTPVEGTLVSGEDTAVPSSDIPEQGLATDWVVTSRQVELASGSADTSAAATAVDEAQTWTARFSLLIPLEGESAVPQLKITPRGGDASLDVIVYARAKRDQYSGKLRSEVYRQFHIVLAVTEADVPQRVGESASMTDDLIYVPAAHLGLATSHEWATPPGELAITVIGQQATVKGDVGPNSSIDGDIVPWAGVQAQVAGRITNVRASTERFRSRWESYLNDIDPADLARRLSTWSPDEWDPNSRADAAHRQKWEEVQTSDELRDVAFDGRSLFEAFFPARSELRAWIDALKPGHRLDISWTPKAGAGFVPSIPWGLMYLLDVPPQGQPVDPMGFLGRRFRIGYVAHAVQAGSKALGGLNATHRANFLYWGDNDVTGREARWQQQQWTPWKNQVFIPAAAQGPNLKAELLRLLSDPAPAPMAVLYLFCQCKVGQGNDPVLGFSGQMADAVRRTELGTTQLADRPLIFANACTSAGSDPYIANELEQAFFDRGCRAYLGTETKVPIEFASRFASIFFHFFYRLLDSKPMAAGEAVAQTRLFLWAHYQNIGGLFYTYVNQYELFMADDAEVVRLRAP